MYKEKVESLARKARELDPYFKLVTWRKIFSELKDEIEESIEALDNNDIDELEEELWDILWVFLILVNKLEIEDNINIEKIYEKIYKKMSSRKSFLLENREVTMEEAIIIWNKAKKAEWYPDERLWSEKRL